MVVPKRNKLCIVHIIDTLTVGGAEILLKNTINILNQYRHFVLYLNGLNELKSQFVNENVEFVNLGHTGWKTFFKTRNLIRKIIRREEPCIVHSHLFASTIYARISVPKTVPLVSTLHSIYSIDAFQKSKKGLWAERLTLRRQHVLIAVSNFVLNDYLEFVSFKGQRFVLYNFLPRELFLKNCNRQNNEVFRCIAIGNLKEAKNYHYLLSIFKELKGAGITLDIFGIGSLESSLQEVINRNELPVRLRGGANNIKNLFTEYDLFIQASEHEGFGLSVIEAMASGLPVFLSDIPIFKEITGGFAHFFPLDDHQKAASILKDLKVNLDQRTYFIEPGYAFCMNNYSEDIYKIKLLDIYKKLDHRQ